MTVRKSSSRSMDSNDNLFLRSLSNQGFYYLKQKTSLNNFYHPVRHGRDWFIATNEKVNNWKTKSQNVWFEIEENRAKREK